MLQKLGITMCVVTLGLAGLSLATRAQDAAKTGKPEPFKPVASLDSLMRGQEQQFEALRSLLKDTEVRGRTAQLVRAAELLAELANVNQRHAEDRADYDAWTVKMRTLALEIAGEAKKRKSADEGKMNAAFKSLEATCNACHDMYQ